MGLNTSHNAFDGPYSSFGEWREWVAKQVGIDLEKMEGFGGTEKFDNSIPLYPLLDHSDCDGEISWKNCKKIADGLRSILDKDPEDPSGWNILTTEKFITGCISAFQSKENLEFN